MRYLWDTCVLSELGKPNHDPEVARYIASIPTQDTWISAITIGEIEYGLKRLPIGKRRMELESVMYTLISELSSRILPVTYDIARIWGELTANVAKRGYQLEASDGLIAATAIHHGLHVVTRNVKDFEPTGALILNPWEMEG